MLRVHLDCQDLALQLLELALEWLCLSFKTLAILVEVHGLEGTITEEDSNAEARVTEVLILEDLLDLVALDSFTHGLLANKIRNLTVLGFHGAQQLMHPFPIEEVVDRECAAVGHNQIVLVQDVVLVVLEILFDSLIQGPS